MTQEHFALDEDLLGRFVLGTLDAQERETCELHLRRCEICQRAVRQEQRLAAGVRRLGRDQMKERLSKAVGSERGNMSTWLQIVGVAATVCIIIGVGILNRWWDLRKERGLQPMHEIRTEETARTSPQAPDNRVAGIEGKTSSSEQAVSRDAGSAGPERDDEELRAPSPTEATGGRTRKEEHPGMDALKASEAAKTLAAAKPRENIHLDARSRAQISRQPQRFWIQGVLIPSPASSGPAATNAMRPEGKKDKASEAVEQRRLLKTGQDQPDRGIAIQQQPMSLLPAGQQQTGYDRREVTTEVEDLDEQTIFTLYLDTLLDPAALRTARVRYVTPDSLIVEVGSHNIGYRMPGNWVHPESTEAGKVR